MKAKLLILLGGSALVFLYFHFGLDHYLTFPYLKAKQAEFFEYHQTHRPQTLAVFFAAYVAVTALSLPGAAIMTLAAGAVFGLFEGAVLVSFASTLGATLAFLISRFFLHDYVQSKFHERLRTINRGVSQDGAFYLFTLRLIPAVPFFAINLAMGLTPMKVRTFYAVSQIGMLPGTLVYVNAGTQLAHLRSPADVFSPGLILSFALLGLFPLLAKKSVGVLKGRRYLKRYKKPAKFDYNLVAIGAGAAGLVTAYIAAAVKAKAALIEKHKMGGDCLNYGCVPSKAIIKSAKVAETLRRASDFGIRKADFELDFSDIMERVKRVQKKIEPHDSIERYTRLGVDCIFGQAKIISPYEVRVNGKVLTTRNIVIATGAAPLIPAIPGLDRIEYLTSDTLWELSELPARLLVLGGGPIGCELAQAFARLGARVTLVEKAERLMGREDQDVSLFIEKIFRNEGIEVLTGHAAREFSTEGARKFLLCESNGQIRPVEFDRVLLAVGRAPRVSGYGLEDLDIKLTAKKTIEVNEFLQTNYPNIFACGDVAGPYQFTHTAAHQAWYASVNALFGRFKKFKADYRVIPWCTYTDPEAARVGLNELEAKEKNIPYEVTVYGIDDLDRAITDEEDHGFVKVLTVPGKDKILGVTIVGPRAGDLIAEYVAAMKHGIGLNAVLGTIHIYPTLAEANKYAAGEWKRAHAPQGLLRWVERYHSWMRG